MKKNMSIKTFFFLFLSIQLHSSDSDNESSINATTPQPTKEKSSLTQFLELPATRATGRFAAYLSWQAWQGTKYLSWQAYLAATKRQDDTSAQTLSQSSKKNHKDFSSGSESDCGSGLEDSDFELVRELPFFIHQKELQNSLQKSPEETIQKLNKAMRKCYGQDTVASTTNQQDLAHIITLLQESHQNNNTPLSIAPVIADLYNAQQRAILIQKVLDHTQRVIPRAQKEHTKTIKDAAEKRDAKIARAHSKFNATKMNADLRLQRKINTSRQIIKTSAIVSECINSYATKKEADAAHDLSHFESDEKYLTFLTTIREQNPLKIDTAAAPIQPEITPVNASGKKRKENK